jgi:uncharacterized protein (TIGR02145 family)
MNKPALLFLLLILADRQSLYAQESISIGRQIWMTHNLDVDTFCNGDPIPEAKSAAEWKKAGAEGKPAWCYYNNDPSIGSRCGKLYNWYAVSDPRNLCPEGWHIPSDDEWKVLESFLGGAIFAAVKLKSNTGWSYMGNGNNSSGFSALPGGIRYNKADFIYNGKNGYWWTSTPISDAKALSRFMSSTDGSILTYVYQKKQGLSVRCIKD